MSDDVAAQLERVHEATQRMVRTVDGLPDEAYAEPSVLPGWSRAHVVAHLALNAEALAAVLSGAASGRPVPMYPSQAQRDADIEQLIKAEPATLRDRLMVSSTTFRETAEALSPEVWAESRFVRIPDAPELPLRAVLDMRLREVEIHTADLDAGMGAADWPEPFLDEIFNLVVHDRQDDAAMLLRTPDGDVLIGNGYGPAITGSRADLAWWLLGRGTGRGLSVDHTDGETGASLPTLGPWQPRTPAR